MDRNSADTLVGLSGAWHCHSQDAVLERCARPVVFDTVRKADPTFEAAIASFRIAAVLVLDLGRSEEHTSELQSLMRISYAVFCLKKKKTLNKYMELM